MSSGGELFRQAWIDGVRAHYPGDPKPAYVAPWQHTPDWERECAAAVHAMVTGLLSSSTGAAAGMTRTQKGQFVAVCWAAHIRKLLPDAKPAYSAGWDDLPAWQQETDADIFEAIERTELARARLQRLLLPRRGAAASVAPVNPVVVLSRQRTTVRRVIRVRVAGSVGADPFGDAPVEADVQRPLPHVMR